MKEKEITLKSYRKEIEIISMTIDVPSEHYANMLLKLFNNKRDNKEIMEITNYYENNKITTKIDLTQYVNDARDKKAKEECIEHLKEWYIGGLDISKEAIDVQLNKGYVYSLSEYENNIDLFDEKDNIIYNYIKWED